MAITKLSSIGFTLEHETGKIEVVKESVYGETPSVFVRRNRGKNVHGYSELSDALKNGWIRTSGTKKIHLLPEEMDFLAHYKPIFEKLDEVDTEKVWLLLRKGE